MAEGKVLLDAVFVGVVHDGGFAEAAAALGAFALQEMASAGAMAQHFARGRYFETLGHGLFRFDTFGTSHKNIQFLSKKERAI
jgi:hypothetical protein